MKKIRIGILFGGQSAEHEVSIRSAKNVYDALDKSKYDPVLVGITKKGEWISLPPTHFLSAEAKDHIIPLEKSQSIAPVRLLGQEGVDVVFPVLHGPFGEDGTVQGMLKLLGIPFVGPGILGSAVGMDKDVAKRLMRDAGIPVAPFVTFYSRQQNAITFEQMEKDFGLPLFVKPANLGSSVGVSKVQSKEEFEHSLHEAYSYDQKILIEKGIDAREIECAVLGNEDMKASVLGEIIPRHEFYDYDAKYIDSDGAGLEIPAVLSSELAKQIQELAIKTCRILEIEGMARVDFFLERGTSKIFVNEVNTIPGFTSISMYPKLWEASGLSYKDLIDRLISLARDRCNREGKLKTAR